MIVSTCDEIPKKLNPNAFRLGWEEDSEETAGVRVDLGQRIRASWFPPRRYGGVLVYPSGPC